MPLANAYLLVNFESLLLKLSVSLFLLLVQYVNLHDFSIQLLYLTLSDLDVVLIPSKLFFLISYVVFKFLKLSIIVRSYLKCLGLTDLFL